MRQQACQQANGFRYPEHNKIKNNNKREGNQFKKFHNKIKIFKEAKEM